MTVTELGHVTDRCMRSCDESTNEEPLPPQVPSSALFAYPTLQLPVSQMVLLRSALYVQDVHWLGQAVTKHVLHAA